MLYISSGILVYHESKLIVEVDQDLADYYRSFIKERNNRQRYPAHISVVRNEPIIKQLYNGEEIEFLYDSDIKNGKVYWWLNVFCKRLEEIRLELGLPVSSPFTLPPTGFIQCFHITIANCKE